MTTRKQRGHDTQNATAAWFRGHGWPHAESAGAGRPGTDVLGMPGLHGEVKARRELRLTEWLRQAGKVSALSFVVHRPDGFGPARIAEWPVTMRLDEFTHLLFLAGFGDGNGKAIIEEEVSSES